MTLLSFGFNGFEQIRQETNITRILFTSWETAIVVVNGNNKDNNKQYLIV